MPTTRRGFMGLGAGGLALCACAGERVTLEPGDCPEPAPEAAATSVGEGTDPHGSGGEDPYASLRGMCDGVAPVDTAELSARRVAMSGACAEAGAEVFVTEAGPTLEYLGGARWGRSERPLLMLLFEGGEPVFVGPAFEEGKLRERLGSAATIRTWDEHESPYGLVAAILDERRAGRARLLVDPETRMFVVEGLRGAAPRASIEDGGALVARVRMRKSPLELSRLRRANEATKAALRVVSGLLRPGMSESDGRRLVTEAQQAAGLSEVWALVLFGPNAAFPHGTGHERSLQATDLILVDTGGSLHGYRSDITRTWPVERASSEQRAAFAAVLAAQSAALEVMRPGRRAADVDEAARRVIAEAGFGEGYAAFTHRLGHGIGLEVHEPPYMVMDSPLVLEPGMTMSNEPGIYLPGKLGVRLEDIVAITETAPEVFGPRAAGIDAPFGPA